MDKRTRNTLPLGLLKTGWVILFVVLFFEWKSLGAVTSSILGIAAILIGYSIAEFSALETPEKTGVKI